MRFTFVSASSEALRRRKKKEMKIRKKNCRTKSEKGKHIMCRWQSAEGTELGKGQEGKKGGRTNEARNEGPRG